jgi:hypothetical protein
MFGNGGKQLTDLDLDLDLASNAFSRSVDSLIRDYRKYREEIIE